ncbi:zinc-binding dehydrogenase [Arthrobacter sp. UC242_113]|uniref:zinc-dependent alcohol dehydrogenase n=1 Tax=Arthrobacter sp. UC242_113 TaxID=3374550 RepID=UPI00375734F4
MKMNVTVPPAVTASRPRPAPSIMALTKSSSTPEDVSVLQRPVPELATGELLVQTLACGLCGSDVHAWRQDNGYEWVQSPVTLGHEAVGRVIACGPGVPEEWINRRVVPIAIDGCGNCDLCTPGTRQLCRSRSVLGLSFDGCASEKFSIPVHRAVPVDSALPAETLALTEPLSVAFHAVTRLEESLGKTSRVVISGPGPIGLMCALLLKDHGHSVTLIGAPRDEEQRLPLARTLGLETLLAGQPLPPNIVGWLEASGAPQALKTAISAVHPGGTIVMAGLFPSLPAVDVNVLARNEVRLLGSYGSVAQDYRDALAALEAAPERWRTLITTIPLSEGTRALQTAADAGALKVVLLP